MKEDIMIMCRELDKYSKRVSVYELKGIELNNSIFLKLNLRSRFNPELEYFYMKRSDFENNKDKITSILKSNQCETKISEFSIYKI